MKHVLALMLILLQIVTILASSTSSSNSFDAATSFIVSTCRSVTHPKLCENTCMPFAVDITVDVKRMAHYALNSTLVVVKSASWTVYKVSKEKKLKPSDRAAVTDCVKLTMDSVAKIKKSIEEVDRMGNGKRFDKYRRFKLLNVKTWMSATMMNYQTCMESLEEMNASVFVKINIAKRIRYAMMLSSNALAIVNKIK